MHKNFEINLTKIKGGCKLGKKVVTHNSNKGFMLTNLGRGYYKLQRWQLMQYLSSRHPQIELGLQKMLRILGYIVRRQYCY